MREQMGAAEQTAGVLTCGPALVAADAINPLLYTQQGAEGSTHSSATEGDASAMMAVGWKQGGGKQATDGCHLILIPYCVLFSA